MIQRGNKYERDLLAVRPQPEDGALVQSCQVFLPCSSWHFRLNHDLVEFRGGNISLEGRTSWEVERLEGEVMHHHGTVHVIWDKLWEKCLKAAQLRGMMGSGWIFCPEGLCYMAGTGSICAKDSFNREKRSGPIWFWELGRQRGNSPNLDSQIWMCVSSCTLGKSWSLISIDVN